MDQINVHEWEQLDQGEAYCLRCGVESRWSDKAECMTDSKYHMYHAAVFAGVAERCVFFGLIPDAQFWTNICIYHLALAFYRLSFECRECERYR